MTLHVPLFTGSHEFRSMLGILAHGIDAQVHVKSATAHLSDVYISEMLTGVTIFGETSSTLHNCKVTDCGGLCVYGRAQHSHPTGKQVLGVQFMSGCASCGQLCACNLMSLPEQQMHVRVMEIELVVVHTQGI